MTTATMAGRRAGTAKPRRRDGSAGGRTSAFLVMALFAVYTLVPVWWLVVSATKSSTDLFTTNSLWFSGFNFFGNLADVFSTQDGIFGRWMLNSVIYCVAGAAMSTVLSCMAGYALAKYDNKWLKAFFICILATTMLPSEVMLAPEFLVVRNLGLYNSFAGIILPAVLTATGCFMFRQFFLTVPDELVEAARIDGARELSIFLRIMVPLSRPIMLTLAILSFQWRWNDYIWPLLMLNDPNKFTVQIGIQSIVGAQNINWSVLLGASVISMIPLIAIFLVFQRYVMSADINAGLKD